MKNNQKMKLVARLQRTIEGALKSAVWHLSGLFKEPGEFGYNPDAAKPPEEWTPRTRTAIIGAEATEDGRRVLAQVLDRWPSAEKLPFGSGGRPRDRARVARSV